MSVNNILLIGNNNTLVLNGLRNADADEFINSAAVLATLKDLNDSDVIGQTWPVVLSYIPYSQGNYRAILNSDINVSHDQHYKLTITAQGDGLTAIWTVIVTAHIRRK